MELNKHEFQLDNLSGKLIIEYLPFVNYVLNINDVPVFEKFTIINEGQDQWRNVEVSVSGIMLLESSCRIDCINVGDTVDLCKKVEIVINPQKLAELTEGDGTFFCVKVTVDGAVVFNKELPLLLQAYDQWVGSSFRPELLAAFVTPNHPLISRIISNAAPVLQRLTGSNSFDAYQSGDPNRVRCQVAAIYEALRAQGLSYISPPASFESHGQRVRLIDKVLDEKLGTCVDLSLLFASCLEAIGLNPLIILTRGHCFVGCWLVRDTFPQSVCDDCSFLLKGVSDGISEIVVMEATCLTHTDNVSFEESCALAVNHLNAETEFECFIDVYQSRVNNVRPIPLKIRNADGTWQIVNDGAEHDPSAGKVKQLDRYDLSAYDSESAEVTMYTIWERKLLDFSLRNTLLNIRSGNRIIPLLSFAIDSLEDFLQDGKSFSVRPFPLDTPPVPGERGLFESSVYASVEQYVLDEMKQRRLFSFLMEDALDKSLKYVYRASRTSLEENGANSLYLVLGLLKWYETDQSKDAHYAPILLLPIEIVRTLNGGGYTIRARDEDASLNITMSELLRQQHDIDLSVLSELPMDEHGVDVKKILAIVRNKIRNKRGWNVLDETLIGIFSFNKFVMWNDIHSNADQLKQHDIISSLVDAKLNIDVSQLEPVDISGFDKDQRPADYLIPIDVDSSQLEAIIASGQGRSFILHGPPGTGKSQTITNIIANSLYQGKRVLFVAEKMAALEVVQDRLSKIGLAPFCLELHSNKATKQHFLHQMEQALTVARDVQSPDYQAMSDKVFEKRHEILAYVDAMHRKDHTGFSLYDCIEHYFAAGECSSPLLFSDSDVTVFTPEKIDSAIEMIRAMAPVLKLIGSPDEHPLKQLHVICEYDMAERRLREHLVDSARSAVQFDELARQFDQIWGAKPLLQDNSDKQFKALVDLFDAPLLTPNLIRLILQSDKIPMLFDTVNLGENANNESWRIANTYSRNYLDIDTQALWIQYQQIESKWFLTRHFASRKLVQQLPPSNTVITFEQIPNLVGQINSARAMWADFKARESQLVAIFGSDAVYNGKWHEMRQSLETVSNMASQLNHPGCLSVILQAASIERMANACENMDTRTMADARLLCNKLSEAYANFCHHYHSYSDYLGSIDGDLIGLTNLWANNVAMLKDWIIYCRSFKELTEFVGKNLSKQLSAPNPIDNAVAALQQGFYAAKAQKMISENPTLNYFSGVVFDDTIQRYRELTAKLQVLSKAALYHRLATNLPSMSMMALDTSELGILKRNIKSGGRGRSIRSIMDLVPTLLPKLCPCMLMSPISVAQYISLDAPKFDIVIFDEASQMPTSEAVGAIARGNSLIVVGDPQQMPPTSFFSASAIGEDEAHIDDMNSILDDCLALSIPSIYLTWHYRSKHESLITFSNHQYYDGKLTTFPSVDNMRSKVSMRYISGIYERSRSRCNVAEAKAIVDEVIRRLADPKQSKYSIGIVAFSKVQQDKIEDLLNAELARHPDLEAHAFNSPEPVFVKNLENVQGDERDVILFSVGYGPDKDGKVSMNFGPLNNSGGERRLNVAVSRARYEMVVFSSLMPEQIDLRRTNALGVIGLKHFLEYASTGTMSDIQHNDSKSIHNRDNVLARMLQIVEDAGYEYDINVGSSNFKVDVAIKNPAEPDKYILGLLLDGPAYFAAKTTRDREIVQPSVLKLLKWNIMKVWTLDLMNRPQYVRDELVSKLQDIVNGNTSEPESSDSADDLSGDGTTSEFSGEMSGDVGGDDLSTTAVMPDQPRASFTQVEQQPAINTRCLPYQALDIDLHSVLESPEQLYARSDELRELLMQLIQTEAPITNTLLYKRVVKAFGLTRVSPKVQQAVNAVLSRLPVYAQPNGTQGTVYWMQQSDSDGYDKYRIDSGRDITDVPYVEIENAMLYVLGQQIALEADDLKRLTANQLGYTRKGATIEAVTSDILRRLNEQHRLVIDGTKVKEPNRS